MFEDLLKKLAEEGETSFLAGARWRIIRALDQLNVKPEVVYHLIQPSRLIQVLLPVEYEGKTYFCWGIRAWFDNGKLHSPGQIVKGGIRFISVEPQNQGRVVTIKDEEEARKLMLDDVLALGLEMLAKNAGTNFKKNVIEKFLPIKKKKILQDLDIVGGAKGVIVVPRSLHLADHNQFVRKALEVFGYKLGLMGIVGWDRDVPAGDIGTTGVINGKSVLDGFVDGYERALKDLKIKMKRNFLAGVITGKTADKKYLGHPARATATGFGTVEALKVWADMKKKKLKDLKVVFDGAGNAALPAAKFLVSEGIKVIGMTDSRSVIFKNQGLNLRDLQEISEIKRERKSLSWWAQGRKEVKILKDKIQLWQSSGMNVLFVSSDAMIINFQNVAKLPKNLLIVDGANGPVTPKAEEKLVKLGIEHLTGSFANAGGVIGSLIEWVNNVAELGITYTEAETYIRACMESNFKAMTQLVKNGKVDSLADAFYFLAMKRFLHF